jgi:hypothetical protein
MDHSRFNADSWGLLDLFLEMVIDALDHCGRVGLRQPEELAQDAPLPGARDLMVGRLLAGRNAP